jgi:chaperonin GroEL (HSP60 family)
MLYFIQELISKISEDISSGRSIRTSSTISQLIMILKIGKLIATALEKVGHEGVVHIEESKSGETYLETVEGMQIRKRIINLIILLLTIIQCLHFRGCSNSYSR